MTIDKKMFDNEVATKYEKWLKDCQRLIAPDRETAMDILNDVILYTYNRIYKHNGKFECDNVDGYIYQACRMSKCSTTSPYQRKRWLHCITVPIDDLITV